MANRVTMTICGQDYTLVADESAAYMQKVGLEYGYWQEAEAATGEMIPDFDLTGL